MPATQQVQMNCDFKHDGREFGEGCDCCVLYKANGTYTVPASVAKVWLAAKVARKPGEDQEQPNGEEATLNIHNATHDQRSNV